jgi:chemotaxis protein CheY-P-specific phosphatase CheC
MFCLLRVLRDALKQYNITSQYFTGKENEMLQEITIQTTDLEQFKSVLQIALERESKLLEYSIQRTREALAPFEQRYSMTTNEFERKFNAREIEETLDFLDWWMEVEALRHLEARRNLIKDARVE